MGDFGFLNSNSEIPPGYNEPRTPPPNYKERAQAWFSEFVGDNWFAQLLAILAGAVVSMVLTVIGWAIEFIDVMFAGVGTLMIAAQAQDRPEFYELVAAIITDLLGVEVNVEEMQKAAGDRGRLAAMDRVGSTLFDTLAHEFVDPESNTNVGPAGVFGGDAIPLPKGQTQTDAMGATAARRFLGFVMSFAVREGNLAVFTEFASLGFLKNFREYGEGMARNLGLGRLTRRALQPLIQVLIADPMTEELNYTYRPKALAEASVVKAMLRGWITADDAKLRLARMGYSDPVIQALFDENTPVLAPEIVAELERWSVFNRDAAFKAIKLHGYDDDRADLLLSDFEKRANDAQVLGLIDEVIQLARSRFITIDQVNTILTPLPLYESERKVILQRIGLILDSKNKRLTTAQVDTAYLDGIVTLDYVRRWWTEEGYNQEDRQVLEFLLLVKQKDTVAAETAKADAAKAKADKASAAAEAKAHEQAALALGTAGRPLTFAEAELAYTSGIWNDDQFKTFLTAFGYAGAVLDTFFLEEQDKRDKALAIAAKAAELQKKAETTKLSQAQVDESYIAGVLSPDKLLAYFDAAGFTPDDAQTLKADLDIKKDAADAKKAADAAKAAGELHPKLSFAQSEAAYIAAILTRDQFMENLAELGYSPQDADVVTKLADEKVAAAQAKSTKAGSIRASGKPVTLSLAQETAAYVAGQETRADFAQFITDKGYSEEDSAIILQDADQKRAIEQNKQAASGVPFTEPTGKPISVAEAEALFVAGTWDVTRYQVYLHGQGYSDEDVALLSSLAATKKARAASGTPAGAATPKATAPKKLSIAEVEQAFLAGEITGSEVDARLQALGYGTRDRGILFNAMLLKQGETPLPLPPAT